MPRHTGDPANGIAPAYLYRLDVLDLNGGEWRLSSVDPANDTGRHFARLYSTAGVPVGEAHEWQCFDWDLQEFAPMQLRLGSFSRAELEDDQSFSRTGPAQVPRETTHDALRADEAAGVAEDDSSAVYPRRANREFIGRAAQKDFGGELRQGRVVQYDGADSTHKVRYSDGEEEWYTKEVLQQLLTDVDDAAVDTAGPQAIPETRIVAMLPTADTKEPFWLAVEIARTGSPASGGADTVDVCFLDTSDALYVAQTSYFWLDEKVRTFDRSQILCDVAVNFDDDRKSFRLRQSVGAGEQVYGYESLCEMALKEQHVHQYKHRSPAAPAALTVKRANGTTLTVKLPPTLQTNLFDQSQANSDDGRDFALEVVPDDEDESDGEAEEEPGTDGSSSEEEDEYCDVPGPGLSAPADPSGLDDDGDFVWANVEEARGKFPFFSSEDIDTEADR